ncbi:arsenate reductase [Qipengyuania sediminis]|uniref:arsenate reductase n=1 Tax=Qipengyuania sediminis TaxID=1532023 RepID=UPI001059B40D|nr:arsenate reductase [Qipengyuania sediminis]
MTIELFGIANCDSVKRARAWLGGRGKAYSFHDYKREGVSPARLAQWADVAGWEALLNTRGTTWRKLTQADRDDITRDKALALMAAHPSLIKRPVIAHSGGVLVGFDPARWAAALD